MSDYLHQLEASEPKKCPKCGGELKLRYQEKFNETHYWQECSSCSYQES